MFACRIFEAITFPVHNSCGGTATLSVHIPGFTIFNLTKHVFKGMDAKNGVCIRKGNNHTLQCSAVLCFSHFSLCDCINILGMSRVASHGPFCRGISSS